MNEDKWLMIDNYDSFSYILLDYIQRFHEEVVCIKNDEWTLDQIIEWQPARIIISPGPKSPEESGICREVVLQFFDKVPILGVCLGHQLLGSLFGGEVLHAPRPMHGKVVAMQHFEDEIFINIPITSNVMRYHSLQVQLSSHSDLEIIAKTVTDDIIMAVKHRQYPIYGLQFHPESVGTEFGLKMIENWCNLYQ